MEKNWFNKEIKDVEAELKTDLENYYKKFGAIFIKIKIR